MAAYSLFARIAAISPLVAVAACGGDLGGDSASATANGGGRGAIVTGGSAAIVVDAGRPQCLYNGVLYDAGDTFASSDACNSCTCGAFDASVSTSCTDDPECHACIQNGQGYPLGAAMTGNVCATCICELVSGTITPSCDPVSPCPATCVYVVNAQVYTYDAGTTFPLAPGDCNKCICDPSTYLPPGYNCPAPHTCPVEN